MPSIQPNLLVIGAMKASTTLFYNLLGRHPQVWFPPEKEPHFFSSPRYEQPGAWEAYLRLFADCPPGRTIIGEASTGYTKQPHLGPVPQRIRKHLGQPRLIYLLRDPVKRTISNFEHVHTWGGYPPGRTLSEAMGVDPIIVDASCYARQLRAYHAEFGPDSVLVVIAEDLHRRPAEVMEQVRQYLGLAPFTWESTLDKANSGEQLRATAGWARVVGRNGRLKRWAQAILPGGMRRWLKRLGPGMGRGQEAPPVTPEEERQVLDRVAEDLRDLMELLGPRGAQLAELWPSARRLGVGARPT